MGPGYANPKLQAKVPYFTPYLTSILPSLPPYLPTTHHHQITTKNHQTYPIPLYPILFYPIPSHRSHPPIISPNCKINALLYSTLPSYRIYNNTPFFSSYPLPPTPYPIPHTPYPLPLLTPSPFPHAPYPMPYAHYMHDMHAFNAACVSLLYTIYTIIKVPGMVIYLSIYPAF